MSKYFILTGIAIVVVGAASFYGGMQYQNSLRGAGRVNGFGAVAGLRGAQNRPVNGEVVSIEHDGLTVKMPDGSTKIINVASETAYTKTASASATEVQVGTKVGIFGQTNSDGSVTAQTISINPAIRGGFGGGR